MGEELLTSPQAATLLQVTEETVRRWAEERKIRHIRLPSGQLRFRRQDVEEILTPVEPSQAS